MSVPKRIVNLIDAKNEEIMRLEAEKAESEHALGFAVDAVERLEAEKSEMLEALEYAIAQVPELASVPGIESAIRKARAGKRRLRNETQSNNMELLLA